MSNVISQKAFTSAIAVCVIAVHFVFHGMANAEMPEVTKVISDWQKRRSRIKQIEYVLRCTETIHKGYYTKISEGAPLGPPPNMGILPAEDQIVESKVSLTLDLANSCRAIASNLALVLQ